MLPKSEIEALVRLRTLTSTIGSCTQKVMIDKSTVRGCSRRSNFVLIIPLMIIITGRGRNESELSQGSGARARGRGWGYLGKCLLGMCRWPLRAPTPFLSNICKPEDTHVALNQLWGSLRTSRSCPIFVYFLANYRPHLSHLLENVIFTIPTQSLSIYASTLSIVVSSSGMQCG